MEPHILFTCIIAVTLLTLTPGVDTMLIIKNSARGGWVDGAVSSLGICSGLFVHAAISALGISIILLQTAWAFTALKFAGAAYLVWLGLCCWTKVAHGRHDLLTGNISLPQKRFHFFRSFREGFLSNVLNPKTVFFYMAFLPQFIDPNQPPLFQSLLVAGIHFSVAMLYQCTLAALVDRARVWLQRPIVNRMFNALTGSILMFIGAKIALED